MFDHDGHTRCLHCKAQHDTHVRLIRCKTGKKYARYEQGLLVGMYDSWLAALIGTYPVFIDEALSYPPQPKYNNHLSWNEQFPGYTFKE